ncbi:MAG: hydroxymethylglutaryl-CoA lyase [Ferruginibacter sp.]
MKEISNFRLVPTFVIIMIPGDKIRLIECPRDAMQGWKPLIPTVEKTRYINALLKVGFDTIDFGSFVSVKAIPQLADTSQVIKGLRLGSSATKLLAIVANERGATDALVFDEIAFLGYPFSISPTFQLRNTNSTIEGSLVTVEAIQNLCVKTNKALVIYISMGFGNPYHDAYSEALVQEWVDKIVSMGITIISVADTIGLATPAQVSSVMNILIPAYPSIEIGVHLHCASSNWQAKADAAIQQGCRRLDGALRGIGGCPMAGDDLVGNMDTELMIPYFDKLNLLNNIDKDALANASRIAAEIFNNGHF